MSLEVTHFAPQQCFTHGAHKECAFPVLILLKDIPHAEVYVIHTVYTHTYTVYTYLAMSLDNWFAFDPVLDTGSADQGFGCQQKLIGQVCLPVLSLTAN